MVQSGGSGKSERHATVSSGGMRRGAKQRLRAARSFQNPRVPLAPARLSSAKGLFCGVLASQARKVLK